VTGRFLHKHEIEADALERELAAEEQSLRARLDQGRQDLRDRQQEQERTPPKFANRKPITIPDDEQHRDTRVVEISKLRDKHNDRRKALRDRHVRELATARATSSTGVKHEPQKEPLPHQPTFEIWRDLDAARQEAVRGVFRSTALLRDDADAEHLDVSKTAGRYMGQVATQNAAQSRHERSHYDLSKKEHRDLEGLEIRFKGEIESERRRIHQQAVERGELAKRQYAENLRASR
jgi:hypothetical protein